MRRPPLDLGSAQSMLVYVPVSLGLGTVSGARIGGAWKLVPGDPRLGGVSGLAIDRGRLVALTDSGLVAWLDVPATPRARAVLVALPAVPGNPHSKIGRDSEALARDPLGRGWWVAFEQVHQLLLFDPAFRRVLAKVRIVGPGFRPNRGIEAITSTRTGIGTLPESGGTSDAVRLADGRVARLMRRFTLLGFRSSVEGVGEAIALPLGPFDNPEAITAAPLANGGTRLWIMTDNDYSRWRPTLLIAVDLPPGR